MTAKLFLPALAALCLAVSPLPAEDRTAESFSRVFIHHDGSYTRSWKYAGKNEICEETYREDDVRQRFTAFLLDNRGRIQIGSIFDGSKTKKIGTVEYGYDLKTERLVVQRTYDERGRRVEEVYMPEAFDPVKYPEFAKRGVRLRFNPNDTTAKPVADTKNVKVAMPSKESGGQKFEPGMLIGSQAPSMYETEAKEKPKVDVPDIVPTTSRPAMPSTDSARNQAAPPLDEPAPVAPKRASFLPMRSKNPPASTTPPAVVPPEPPKKTVPPAAPSGAGSQPAVPPPAVPPAGTPAASGKPAAAGKPAATRPRT